MFGTPYWLLHYYTILGYFSLIINLIGLYLVLFKSSTMGNYKYNLLYLQLSCTFLYIIFLHGMKPITFLPIMGLSCKHGVLWRYLGISSRVSVVVFAELFANIVISMTSCFLKKYSAVTSVGKRNIIPTIIIILVIVFNQICIIVLTLAIPTKQQQLNLIPEEYNNYFDILEDYLLFEMDTLSIIFIVLVPIGASLIILIIFLITVKMFDALSIINPRQSETNTKRHKIVLKSLIAQSLTTVVFLVPCIIFVFVTVVEISNGN
ncbi:unnamed protein product [Caenorhabditis angaria]|uniref:Uncharacterized protein n=1 Tax=Caenorhabditis angaria TaxID=860376 RepID=A0A9P1IVC0_9PELO|nr:unnamed protein product [Caenorhabditis angaria]